jgi:PII-like signaling protein
MKEQTMEPLEDGRLLRIIVGEDDEYDGRPLYEAIVLALREQGLAGATVYRGIMGFGASSVLHSAHVLRLSEDLPIVIECVDRAEAVEAVLPVLDDMIGEGLVTVERADVRIHRGRHPA